MTPEEKALEAVKAWLLEEYGEKCPDFDGGCIVCKKWKQMEDLFYE